MTGRVGRRLATPDLLSFRCLVVWGGVFRRPTLDLGIRRLSTPDTRLSYAGSILSTADNFWPIKDYGPKLERSGGIGPAVRAGFPYQREPLGSVYGLLISVPFTKPIQATKSLLQDRRARRAVVRPQPSLFYPPAHPTWGFMRSSTACRRPPLGRPYLCLFVKRQRGGSERRAQL